MKKKSEEEGGKVNFDDGVYITVPGEMPKPRHLQFYCKTSMSGSAEACDLRLAKVKLPSSSTEDDDIIAWKDSIVDDSSSSSASTSADDRRNLLGHELISLPYRTLLDEQS